MKSEFDLVICFVGSAACNPFLEHLLKENWDSRFFFSGWDANLINKLLRQQEELLSAGQVREVLILVDDVVLGSKADEQLAHLSMRGRHFRISLMMCAVSYTSLPKRMRRSLDAMLVFSIPMRGDMQVLTYEYCQSSNRVARHVLHNLKDHECLVLETLTKRQQLFIWKADLLTLVEEPPLLSRNGATPLIRKSRRNFPCESQNALIGISEVVALDDRQRKMSSDSDRSG